MIFSQHWHQNPINHSDHSDFSYYTVDDDTLRWAQENADHSDHSFHSYSAAEIDTLMRWAQENGYDASNR